MRSLQHPPDPTSDPRISAPEAVECIPAVDQIPAVEDVPQPEAETDPPAGETDPLAEETDPTVEAVVDRSAVQGPEAPQRAEPVDSSGPVPEQGPVLAQQRACLPTEAVFVRSLAAECVEKRRRVVLVVGLDDHPDSQLLQTAEVHR